ncbi:hypothetical protein PILCRDRAFT_93993 [Piloderma croceum F 1598]|uniref:Ubiquitin-like protease family profile domain-containing protein n=1 Tax=Piloderma croceum (strain F 1598) TaxID=765440 RepID=A0A0C3B1R8_PILCF|nr:hypothetical protein PILCRDRAFT_93993 [Piloderma croceum F 1598]
MLNSATHYIHPTLEIPAKIQSEVFPDVSLSVLDFLQFPLPIVSSTATRHKPSDFFSKYQPNTQNIKAIQKIPIPPAKTVAELVVSCKTAVLSGTHLLKCPRVPSASAERFPVWIIPYWAEVLVLRTTSHKAWGQAEEFLRLCKRAWKKMADSEKTDSIIQEAYDILACIPWSGNIQGFDKREPLHKLATYASCSWLGTTHENQMLDLFGSSIEIANMAFFSTLCKAYEHCDTGEYEDSHSFAWVRGIGEALVNGKRDGLGTMVNIGGDHWVAIALDFLQSVVWYGDLFGQEPVDEVTSVINWWTHHHTGYEFLYWKLKIASQKDGFLCRLIGLNALGHFYLPET